MRYLNQALLILSLYGIPSNKRHVFERVKYEETSFCF